MLDRRFLSVNLVVQGIANSPEANPVAGSQYIVGSNPSGAFAGVATNSIARYDGSAWKFYAPNTGNLEVFNVQTSEILSFNGSTWAVALSINSNSFIPPVLAVVPTGTTLPASAVTGDSFFNTSNATLYTATAANTWDSGSVATNGSRYASLTDFNIYSSNGSTSTAETIIEGGFFLNHEDNSLYIFNGSAFIKIGGDSSSTTVTEVHSLSAAEISAKSFSLANSIKAGEENNILLFVSGVAQVAGTDFTASGNSISWNNKGLDSIGLLEGDSFIVHYVKG